MTSGTVVLVEGMSDRVALERLASRRGQDLHRAGVQIVDVGGVTNFRAFLMRYGPMGQNLRMAGLCDSGEQHVVRRALEAAGFGTNLTPASLPPLGFFVCAGELEDELLRAVGVDALLRIMELCGDLRRFRTMQRQLVYRAASLEVQVRYLMTQRKIEYAPHLIDALDLASAPPVLDRVLTYALPSP